MIQKFQTHAWRNNCVDIALNHHCDQIPRNSTSLKSNWCLYYYLLMHRIYFIYLDKFTITSLSYKGAVILYDWAWGQRVNGWVTEKMESARYSMKNIRC